ncbi:hypothetical protein [Desulfovibrio psychrotolerans]|uniref:Uncharacterized protein n=1 Tax=Desulfovibrio psychrotolerans TaxID=415242 RepID=A0A7J0BT54_9BACT|nr:hypothetical protein [Desulfovibrio psychrotolerans]GFM36896.1 hypothetical protein DSM19430T_15800 [Desulfovibrio psychrotolerans]
MKTRHFADTVVALFDPQLGIEEKAALLAELEVVSAQHLDEAGVLTPSEGACIELADGSVFHLTLSKGTDEGAA